MYHNKFYSPYNRKHIKQCLRTIINSNEYLIDTIWNMDKRKLIIYSVYLMFCLAILSSLCLGNTICFSGNSLSTLNFFGNVSGDPTSKNEILDTGHHFVEFFKITFQDRISDPSVLLISTILLT